MYIDEIAGVFTNDVAVKSQLLQVLPLVFLCFFFDVLQAHREGIISGLNLQRSAVWFSVGCHYGIALTLGIFIAFRHSKGAQGLHISVLIA